MQQEELTLINLVVILLQITTKQKDYITRDSKAGIQNQPVLSLNVLLKTNCMYDAQTFRIVSLCRIFLVYVFFLAKNFDVFKRFKVEIT